MSDEQCRSHRRTVLSGAIWSAPVVVLATAAPAMASSVAARLTVSVASAVGSDGTLSDTLAVTSTITNVNPAASTALTVTLTVTMVNANRWGLAPTATAAGYNNGLAVAGQGTTEVRTFTFTATAQIAASGTKAFSPSVTTGSTQNPNGSVTVLASPGGAGTAGSNTLGIT